jgi:hypothetical protein
MTNSELLEEYRLLCSELGLGNVVFYPPIGELGREIELLKKVVHKRRFLKNFKVVK